MVYSERMGKTFKDSVILSLVGFMLVAVSILAACFEWIRKKLPAPGDGPENVLDDNYFKFTSWALSDDSSGGSTQQAPVRLKSTFAVRSSHDPAF